MNTRLHDARARRLAVRNSVAARSRAWLACLVAAGLAGCATESPVIYPSGGGANSKAQVLVDIQECIELANAEGAGSEGAGQMVAQTVRNSAIGTGTGAVVGAIAGNAGRGAAIGAATTGVGTLLRLAVGPATVAHHHARPARVSLPAYPLRVSFSG